MTVTLTSSHRSLTRVTVAAGSLATTWGLTWSVVMTGFDLWHMIAGGAAYGGHHSWRIHVVFAVMYFIFGFLSGTLFTLIVGFAERRRSVGMLTPHRMALWGASATTVLALLALSAMSTVNAELRIPRSVEYAMYAMLLAKAAILGGLGGLGILAAARYREMPEKRRE